MYNNAPEAGLASLLASRGRNGDSVLVHMTPGEVEGLQALALSQGGSLTINPETGLPEANILKKLLPMIAGAVLAPLTAGTSLAFLGASPLASALTVGAVTGLIEGDLKKGLQAGLGAYSGSSLASGLKAAAATTPGEKVAAQIIAERGTEEAAKEVGLDAAATELSKPSQLFTNAAPRVSPFTGAPASSELASVGSKELGIKSLPTSRVTPGFSTTSQLSAPMSAFAASQPSSTGVMAGLNALFRPEGREAFMTALGGGAKTPLGQAVSKYAVLSGAMGALTPEPEEIKPPEDEFMYYKPGGYNPLYGQGWNQPLFLPGTYSRTYRPPGMAGGGSVVAFEEGGAAVNPDQRRADVLNYIAGLEQAIRTPYSPIKERPVTEGSGREGGGRGDMGDRGDFADIRNRMGDVGGGIGAIAGINAAGNVGAEPRQYGDLNWGNIANTLTEYPLTDEQLSAWEAANLASTQQDLAPVEPDSDTTALVDEALGNQNMLERIIDKVKEPSFYLPAIGGAVAGPLGALIGNTLVPDSDVKVEAEPELITPEAAASGVTPISEGRPGRSSEGGGGIGGGGIFVGGGGSSYASAIPTGTYSGGVFDLETGKRLFKRAGGSIHGYAAGGLGSLSGAVGPDYNFGFAKGGPPRTRLQHRVGGKFLNGDGDGMSDDIHANIDGVQEARLADGEFVIPADVVSHLGNGSSNAGAKKLYAMMDRIRSARTGKKRQAPAVKTERFLPA